MPATEVGKIRNPVRPLTTTNVAMAFPGELLVDPKSGGFIYVTPEGTHLTHRKPGTLTLRYGETVLCDAQDLADAIDLTIPAATAPGKLTLKYGTQTLVDAKSMGSDISVTIPEPEVDVSTLVPVTRTINGHALSANITLSAADVGARPNTWTPTAADVGARPNTWTPTAADVGAVPTSRTVNGKALTENITLSAADVGARPNTWTPSAADVGARPSTWTPTAADVGAVPTGRTVNGKALSSDISLSASDVGAIAPGYAHNIGAAVQNLQLSTSWTGSAAPYTQAITVTGLLATDVPFVDFRPTGTYSTDKTAEEAWLNIYRIVSSANTLTFYAHAKPTVAIPITIKYN